MAACDDVPPRLVVECIEECTASYPPAWVAACADCVTAVACDVVELACMNSACARPAYELVVEGDGFAAWNGAPVYVSTIERDGPPDDRWSEEWPENGGEGEVVGGRFVVRIPAAVRFEQTVGFSVVVDTDGDGACGPQDLAFRQELSGNTGPQQISVSPPAAPDADACLWFLDRGPMPRVFVEGCDFGAHEGKWVFVSLIQESEGDAWAAAPRGVQIENGGFQAYFDSAFIEEGAELVWMIDDGDWHCGPSDTGGRVAVARVATGDQHVAVRSREVSAIQCGAFDGLGYGIRFSSSGWPHGDGIWVEALLLNGDGFVAGWVDGRVHSGSLAIDFGRAGVVGEAYELVLWVDGDDNGICSAPPDDAIRVDMGQLAGDLTVARPWSELSSDPTACSVFEFEFEPEFE